MSKLITVAIPSYRRAAKLDRQLRWLFNDSVGLGDNVEVFVSDNASTDDTPAVCQRWKEQFEANGITCRVNRNEQNVGALPNIAKCIEMADSRFVWVIGDDDEIPAGLLKWVVEKLAADPELASIVLNFRGRGKTVYDRCFTFDSDQHGDGQPIIEACLKQAYFGLAFMTAQVYRTEFARAALKAWPLGRANYDYQVFVTSFVGMQGRTFLSREPQITYITGDNIYETNKRVALVLYADSLEVFLHLRRVGVSGRLCRQLAIQHTWRLKKRFLKRALQNNPVITLVTTARVAAYLARLSVS
jgi:abequosyltransferase